eukprot:6313887-Prymnesium_polylepis.1
MGQWCTYKLLLAEARSSAGKGGVHAIGRRARALLPQSARSTTSVAAMLLFCRFNRLGCAKSDPMGSPGSLAAAGEGGGA